MKVIRWLNLVLARHLRYFEMVGVLMRIISFSLVSWTFNTIDAVLLSWCAILKKDAAYTVLNVFWVGVGIVGILRASSFTHP
jgi:hypothetical protein